MLFQELARLQSDFIRNVGRRLMPLIQMGFGNPLLWPTGAVVVEVADKESGRKYKLPLTAIRIGNLILLTAIQQQASWLQNLVATPEVRYWLAGQPRAATALVLTPEADAATLSEASATTNCLLQFLRQQSRLTGMSFALLVSRS